MAQKFKVNKLLLSGNEITANSSNLFINGNELNVDTGNFISRHSGITGLSITGSLYTSGIDGKINITGDGNISIFLDSLNNIIISGASSEQSSLEQLQTIWIPAGAMTPTSSGGATYGLTQIGASNTMLESLIFSPNENNYAQFNIAFPNEWNKTTLKAIPYYTLGVTGVTGSSIVWNIEGKFVNVDQGIGSVFGTSQTSTGIGNKNYTLYSGTMTDNIVPDGTGLNNCITYFQIYRNASLGNVESSGHLLGIKILYGI